MDNSSRSQTQSNASDGLRNVCINHESWGEPIVVLESLSIIAGNIFVLVVLMKYSRKRFQPLNCFIAQLAVADLFVGGIVFWIGFMSSKAFHYVTLLHGMLNYGILATASSASTLAVLFIAIDRYIYILKHPRYKRVMSKRVVCLAIGMSWTLPTCIFIAAPAMGWSCSSVCDCRIYNRDQNLLYCVGEQCSQMMTPFKKETLLMGGVCLIFSLLSSVLVYVLIVVKVRRKTKQFIKNKRRKKSEMKLIKTMIIVLGGFLLTTGPLAILCVLSYFHNSRQLHSIMRVMVVISNLNSILNPFFYFLRIPYMSKNSKKLWRSFFSRLSRNGRHREIRRISRSMQTQENAVQMIEIAYPLEVPDIKNVSPDPHRNQENCEDDKLPARHSTSSMPWSSHDLL